MMDPIELASIIMDEVVQRNDVKALTLQEFVNLMDEMSSLADANGQAAQDDIDRA